MYTLSFLSFDVGNKSSFIDTLDHTNCALDLDIFSKFDVESLKTSTLAATN